MVYVPEMPRVDVANALSSGFEFGGKVRGRKAQNALARIYAGDESALADLMAADPEAGRQVETQIGARQFVTPATQEQAGPVRPGVDAPLTAQPASVDSEGLTGYLASRGESGALKALMEKMGPKSDEWLGTNVTDAEGNVWGVSKGGGWQQLPGVKAKPSDVAKAPTTRNYTVGSKTVTQEWDANTQQWRTIAEAPREIPREEKKPDPRENLDYEIRLGDRYQRESDSFRVVRQARDNVQNSLAQNSAAGDLAAATSIMKLLDPGSVVRESELGMAMNATGLFGRVGNYAEMLQSGQRLNPQQRQEMMALAKELFGTAEAYNNKTKQRYTDMAREYGLDPYLVTGEREQPTQPTQPPAETLTPHQQYVREFNAAKAKGDRAKMKWLTDQAIARGAARAR